MGEPKKISTEEVFLHCSKNDCWLTIHGKVYDVTKFLEDHPGGDEVLIHASGGGDATQSFEDVGHSSTAMSMMSSYEIGILDGYDPKNVSQKAKASYPRNNGPRDRPTTSFVEYMIPLVILVVAFASWYYLTFLNEA